MKGEVLSSLAIGILKLFAKVEHVGLGRCRRVRVNVSQDIISRSTHVTIAQSLNFEVILQVSKTRQVSGGITFRHRGSLLDNQQGKRTLLGDGNFKQEVG